MSLKEIAASAIEPLIGKPVTAELLAQARQLIANTSGLPAGTAVSVVMDPVQHDKMLVNLKFEQNFTLP